jgi:hypothetical protein
MRTLMTVEIPTDVGTRALFDGTLAETVELVFGAVKPEVAYFSASAGVRTIHAVFDLADPVGICPTIEPFFTRLNAKVDLTPCMNAQELAEGTERALARLS